MKLQANIATTLNFPNHQKTYLWTNKFFTIKFYSNINQDFGKKHSTDSCLTFLHNKMLNGFDKGVLTGMILIDLQKAFDTIDHDILFKKLSAIGLSNHTIVWFKS